MKVVRRLVLIEMTALFDTAKIEWKSNKVIKQKEKGKVTKHQTLQSTTGTA